MHVVKWLIVSLAGGFLSTTVQAQQANLFVFSNKQFPLFVGASGFVSQYEVFSPTTPNRSGTGTSWQLLAGIHPSARLAFQLGFTYSHESSGDHGGIFMGEAI